MSQRNGLSTGPVGLAHRILTPRLWSSLDRGVIRAVIPYPWPIMPNAGAKNNPPFQRIRERIFPERRISSAFVRGLANLVPHRAAGGISAHDPSGPTRSGRSTRPPDRAPDRRSAARARSRPPHSAAARARPPHRCRVTGVEMAHIRCRGEDPAGRQPQRPSQVPLVSVRPLRQPRQGAFPSIDSRGRLDRARQRRICHRSAQQCRTAPACSRPTCRRAPPADP